jgi:hypothetical protein
VFGERKVCGMNFKKKSWLVVAVAAVPLVYLLLISLIPEDRIVGFVGPDNSHRLHHILLAYR